MNEPEQWLRLLNTRQSDDPNLLNRIIEQATLLSSVCHPLDSSLEDESAPLSTAERLVELVKLEGKGFDPSVSLAALCVLQRVYKTAAFELGARLIADMIIGKEPEEKLHKRWADLFEAGAYWQPLVRGNWYNICDQAAQLIKEWANSEGAEQIDGADTALKKLLAGIRELKVEDVIPTDLLDQVEHDEGKVDNDW